MAKTPYPAASHDLIFGDVAVEIYPHGYADWRGSSAQLAAEGLIPNGFKWPKKRNPKCWSAGGLDFLLSRIRPPGLKGHYNLWVEGDYWRLRTTSTAQGRDGFAAARVHQAREVLIEELDRQRTGDFLGSRTTRSARDDANFQAFKLRLLQSAP